MIGNGWKILPCEKVKKPKECSADECAFLDDEGERIRFLAACKESSNPWLYPCVILALIHRNAARRIDGLESGRMLTLRMAISSCMKPKTVNGGECPLAGRGLELLREHAKIRRLDTDLLFPGTIHKTKPIDLRKPFDTALKAAGITDFHWHDLRHCTASYLAMNGASLAEIAEVLGHKTLQMVKRYAHLSDGHVSNVVASMNAKIFGGV